MCKPINWIMSNIQSIISVGSVLIAIILWFITMSDVPVKVQAIEYRVDKVEDRVSDLEKSLEKNNTKTDLILSAVIELRTFIMNGKK